MADAKRDQNFVPTLLAVLNTDGQTVKPVEITPTGHYLQVEDNTTGTDQGGNIAARDQNFVTTMIAVSEDDGVTPVELYINAQGKLLVDSN